MSYCIHYIFYSHVSSTYLYFHQISTSGSLSVTEPHRTFESLIEFNAHRDNIVTWRFTSRSDHVSDMGWRGGSWTDLLHRSHPLDPTSFRRHVTMWSSQPRTVSRAQRTCDRGRSRNELQLGAVTERVRRTESRDHLHPPTHPSILPSCGQAVSLLGSPPLIAHHGLHSRHVQDLPLLPQHGLLGKSRRGTCAPAGGHLFETTPNNLIRTVSEREKANRQ